MRRVTVRDFAHVPDTAAIETLDCTRKERKRRLAGRKTGHLHRLRVERELPGPHRAVVVRGLAGRVLVARVGAAVERMPGIERTDAARDQKLFGRPQDRTVEDDAKRHQKKLVRTNRVLRRRPRGRLSVRRREAVAEAAGGMRDEG